MYALKTFLAITLMLWLSACGTESPAQSGSSTSTSLKVACIGDSITAGFKLANPSTESYPAQLQVLMGTDVEVRNFGHAYATLTKNSAQPYWNTAEFTASHNYNPDIVVILLGTNDAQPFNNIDTRHFTEEYTELIQSYRKLPSRPIVYIAYPPPVYASFMDTFLQNINNDIIPKIHEVAAASGTETIDLYTPLKNKPYYFIDGIHPNVNGAQIIANTVYQSIY